MNKQTIILAGGSGFLGRSLIPLLLNRGYRVVILTRRPTPTPPDADVQEEWESGGAPEPGAPRSTALPQW